jgi:hypothetical protein
MQSFLLGEHTESKGHQYVESESVVGSSDKMMFYMKEMVSEFNQPNKAALNPFLVSKLDL